MSKKITYRYENMPDKTAKGVLDEARSALPTIAFYFQSTYGVPLEIFKEIYNDNIKNGLHLVSLYLNFRNEHPDLFA